MYNVPSAAVAEIESGAASCVVARQGEILHRGAGPGVRPLLALYDSAEGRALLLGADVADKIIGKGAAVILGLAGAGSVYGRVMSQAACDWLDSLAIPYQYGALVPVIQNRAGDGLCPIEASVLDAQDAQAGLAAIRETVARLMAQKG